VLPPTANDWGVDDRLVAFRVTGKGQARRIENRLPGADLNPHVALAAMLGAGLYGIDNGLRPLSSPAVGDGEGPEGPSLPRSLDESVTLFSASAGARDILGSVAINDLRAFALGEREAFVRSVTDWERRLYLEAL
jgi:glutamine synthetase